MGVGNGNYTGIGDALTRRQKEILYDVICFQAETGQVPTFRELAEISEISLGAVQHHFIALKRKGAIKVDKFKPRGYTVSGIPKCKCCSGSGLDLEKLGLGV